MPPDNLDCIRDLGLISGLGRSLEEGLATHTSILAMGRIPMDRGTWRATVHRVTESDRTEATQHMEEITD